MANGENNPTAEQPQENSSWTNLQSLNAGVNRLYNAPLSYTPLMMLDDDERPSLDFYDAEIEKIVSNEQYNKVRDEGSRRAMEMLIRQSGADSEAFFEQYENPTALEAIKYSNFDGYNDKEARYKKDISSADGYKEIMKGVDEEYMSRYISSYLSPELATGINELIPDYIKDDKERQADFEEAFRQQWGVGLDFNDSGRVSDVKADTWIGDFANWIGKDLLNDVPILITDGVAKLSNTVYDLFSEGGLEEADKEFRAKVDSGEVPTLESYQAKKQTGEIGFLEDFFSNPYGNAAFYSTEAREMYLQSSLAPRRDIDFQKFMDRDDSDFGDVWSLGVGELIKSAPLLLDIYSGMGASKAILKKAGQRAIAKKVGQRTIKVGNKGKTATQYFDPANPMRTLKKDYAKEILEKGTQVHRLLEMTSGTILSSTLVAGQLHADLVGEEWYDNLGSSERAWYLANQSGAEVLSGIMLGNVMRGKSLLGRLGQSKVTQNIVKNQRSAIMEWGKQAAKNVVFGMTEEAFSEAGTAAWQYVNEVNTRINSGDRTAYYSNDELWKRTKAGFIAGAVMGIPGGAVGGVVGPGGEAYMASWAKRKIEANKKIAKAVDRFNKAKTKSEKKSALQALEQEIQNNSAVSGSIARAYHRMKKASPEAFNSVVEMQGRINVLVEKYKEAKTPEQKDSIRNQIKALIREKQTIENAAFEGDTTFDDVVKEEVENTISKRRKKVADAKQAMESDPDVLADRAIRQEEDTQRASLEAAEKANSPEQNADDDVQDQQGETQADDVQDQQGETQDDSGRQRNPEAPIEGVEGDANNPMSPTALEGQPLAAKYRDIVGRVNNLLKAFKPLGINAVVHTTEQSFFNATGSTSLGMFRQGKTVHINLEKAKAGANTVRHEFLHAAFMTFTPQQKQQFLEELRSIRGINARNIERAVEEAYSDYDSESLIEEKIVNILEEALDSTSLEARQSTIQKIANSFRRLLGLKEQITESDLQGFVRQFRAAERSGVEFEGGRASQGVDMEARDLGMNRGGFKSTAYPDLIRKKVRYSKTLFNKLGGTFQVDEEVFVNDYWHFRNWWVRETGNGKRADMLSGFNYDGENGQRKKVNAPKPKIDKNTGKPVDMEPRVKTSSEMKIAANQRSLSRRDRARDRDKAVDSLALRMNEIVGVSIPSAREAKSEFFINEAGIDTEAKSELPVVFSDTIFIEGLKNFEFDNEYEAAVRSTMDDFAFLVPKNQAGEFAYSIRNNGDGTVTIEAHSDVKPAVVIDDVGDGESLGEAVSEPKEGLEARDLNIDGRSLLGRDVNRADILSESEGIKGLRTRILGFDRTKKKSGVRDLFRNPDIITAHKSLKEAINLVSQLKEMARLTVNEQNLKEGEIGFIAVAQTLLGDRSTLGNPLVFKEILTGSRNAISEDGGDIKELYVSARDLMQALNVRGSNKNLTQAQQKLRNKLKSFLVVSGKQELIELQNALNDGAAIDSISEFQREAIIEALINSSDDFTFKDRTEIAETLLFNASRKEIDTLKLEDIYEKHNDETWREAGIDLAEIVSFTRIPFKHAGFTTKMDGTKIVKIEGFHADQDPNKSRPFRGIVVPEALTDSGGNAVPKAEIKIPKSDQLYSLADVFPGLEVKFDKKKGKEQVTKRIEELTEEEQQKSLSARAAISAITAKAFDSDNSTRDPESRDLGLGLDNQTELPFEPNNLNSFQAFMVRMDQLFANKYANVMRMQKVIEKAKGKVVDLSKDFINAEALLYGKTANDLDKLDGKVKDISSEMKEKGLNSEDVSQYLIARHAKERNAVISERTDGKDEAGSGMTNERADEIMNSLSPEKKAALESVAAKVDAITADTRKTMVEFGLEEKSTIDAFEAMFQNYVPLGGLALDEQNADTSLYPTGGAGMSVYGDTTKRARGRKSEAQNVLAQAIAQNAAVHAKARKNEALSSLYKLVKDNPNSKVWRLAKEVPFDAQSAVGVRVNGEQQFIVFTNPDMAKSLKNMGVEKLDLFSKAMRRFSGFLRRSFTTANPEFIISNFARDIQSALFNAMAEADIPGGQIPGRHIAAKVMTRVKQTLPALLKNAVGKDLSPEMAAYFEEFKEDGGQTGWGFVKDVGTIAAEIESEVNEKSRARRATEWMAKNSIDVIENINDAFENSVRLAAYIEARKAGVSREKAAELSKNITVNFNRSGELGPMANAWYMFFNASVQGTVRLARSLGTLKDIRKPNGELESWHKRLNGAQKMAFGLTLTTGMLTMINMAMSEDDEDGVSFYEKIPDYEKERNLIIMYDGKNYLKIPLPYGFNVFANMGSSMAEAANGQREPLDAGMFLLNSAFSSFSPISFGQSKDASKYLAKGAAPTILKPFVDIAVNETYFGSSVYREQFPVGAPKPQAEMSYRSPEGIKSFFKWINEATGGSEQVPGAVDFNPDKFWYAFEYYIGGAGQFVTRSLGTGKDLFETVKEGKKVPMKANDFPFIRKLYGEASKYYDSDKYTENANLVSQLYKERKEAEDKNDKRYKGVMKLESARKLTEKKIKKLRKLRKEARDIENYVERQNRIYELYEKERSLLMQFNKQYEQIRGEN